MQRTRSREPTRLLGAFESTYLPGHGADLIEATGHDTRWREDVDAVLDAGVTRLRYPLRWHRIEPRAGVFDWSATDAVLAGFQERGAEPIIDLLHHTSYPEWMTDGFRDRRFGPAFLRYAEAAATRYPWLSSYTLFNEPFATLFLAGHEALWPPYDRGVEGLVRLLRNVLPAVSAAGRCWSELLPAAEHVWVDTCEHHAGAGAAQESYVALANDRRHVVLDLALHHDLRTDRPFLRQLLRAGGEPLLSMPALRVDTVGLDYYCHSEWWYDDSGSHAPSPYPQGFAALAQHYSDRYQRPLLLSETNIRGLPTDRASWLKYMLQEYELAVSRGVPLRGFCWFPYVDSCDWDSLLARSAGRIDPVGVVSLDSERRRVRTAFTEAWEEAAAGARAADLPAYRLQSPCDEQLAGYLPRMRDWHWRDPVGDGRHGPVHDTDPSRRPIVKTAPPTQQDLVVLSHLRWTWVWQRPQHLVSRFSAMRALSGARTWFVEEPVAGDVSRAEIRWEQRAGITRLWLVVPHRPGQPEVLGFDAEGAEGYGELLRDLLTSERRPAAPDVLLYTPLAFDLAQRLQPGRLYYDVMDDLSSFLRAPEGLRLRQRRLLADADVVFAGGRSLHASVSALRKGSCYLFPSGVETSHFAAARRMRESAPRKVAGYVGVIDERVDLDLIGGLADALPDWTVRVAGPVAKIEPSSLPRAKNLEYLGMVPYEELPAVMAGFDVALMPFALNAATRAISPTKTLEYLAAGLPVVSTRVADVVADYTGVVHLADDVTGFAKACREVLRHRQADRDLRTRPIQARQEWDFIASSMHALMNDEAVDGDQAASVEAGA